MATSNNPRKFSEKIALHNQKQAEETAAFDEVMKDLSITRAARETTSSLIPAAHNTGGSLPDLTNIHFPPPLPTPLDPEDSSFPVLSSSSSTGNLAATLTHLGITTANQVVTTSQATLSGSGQHHQQTVGPLTLNTDSRRQPPQQLSPPLTISQVQLSPTLSPLTISQVQLSPTLSSPLTISQVQLFPMLSPPLTISQVQLPPTLSPPLTISQVQLSPTLSPPLTISQVQLSPMLSPPLTISQVQLSPTLSPLTISQVQLSPMLSPPLTISQVQLSPTLSPLTISQAIAMEALTLEQQLPLYTFFTQPSSQAHTQVVSGLQQHRLVQLPALSVCTTSTLPQSPPGSQTQTSVGIDINSVSTARVQTLGIRLLSA
ncbi:UNVERIFIED_CONTAM: hypothetical protein FKN15_005342 [Acipenser sinensis]